MTERATKVILITVDSLRADAVGLYGGAVPTPTIDGLGREGVAFEQAFATGPHTTQSFPGILGSNYPTTGGSVQDFGARVSVAECFRAAGFRTGAFHSNPLLCRARGYGVGFDTFWDSVSGEEGSAAQRRGRRLLQSVGGLVARRFPSVFRLARRTYRALARRHTTLELPHEDAGRINGLATEWLLGAGDRFFLWLHYMDAHWPYATRLAGLGEAERAEARRLSDKALRHPGRLTADDLARLRELYLREIQYVDDCLGRLFDFLRRNGLWDETVIALTGDHGEAFMEHGLCLHGDLLYDELIRVPLIVRAPGYEHAIRRDVASLIDLGPTLCELAGVAPSRTFEGRSMFADWPREAVFAETAYRMLVSETPKRVAVRTAEWKLIRDAERDAEELYHVASDPGETRPVSDGGQVLPRLRQFLREHVSRQRPQFERRAAVQPLSEAEQEAVKARLQALGYLDGVDE